MIVCEVGNIPPHSVPVVIREIFADSLDEEGDILGESIEINILRVNLLIIYLSQTANKFINKFKIFNSSSCWQLYQSPIKSYKSCKLVVSRLDQARWQQFGDSLSSFINWDKISS